MANDLSELTEAHGEKLFECLYRPRMVSGREREVQGYEKAGFRFILEGNTPDSPKGFQMPSGDILNRAEILRKLRTSKLEVGNLEQINLLEALEYSRMVFYNNPKAELNYLYCMGYGTPVADNKEVCFTDGTARVILPGGLVVTGKEIERHFKEEYQTGEEQVEETWEEAKRYLELVKS